MSKIKHFRIVKIMDDYYIKRKWKNWFGSGYNYLMTHSIDVKDDKYGFDLDKYNGSYNYWHNTRRWLSETKGLHLAWRTKDEQEARKLMEALFNYHNGDVNNSHEYVIYDTEDADPAYKRVKEKDFV